MYKLCGLTKEEDNVMADLFNLFNVDVDVENMIKNAIKEDEGINV